MLHLFIYFIEDIEREIDDDDLREVPLVTNSSGRRMISADDSEAYMDALAEFNGLTIVKAKKKAPPKAKRNNNTILPCNLHNYPADPNHAESSNAQADRDKRRASAGNDDRPSKRHHAASVHNDDDDEEDDDKVVEQLRRLLKPKKKVSNRKLLAVARDLL
ncbi:hypothetical protein DXG01_012409 [Tephrocybe rancida]|nr:hypothetical protein DXG01_012409 [Tephrocybe rancida]